MRHVSILLYPQALLSSIGLPREMLQAANESLRRQRRHGEAALIQFVGLSETPVALMGGVKLAPEIGYEAVAETDLIILPALWRDPLTVAQGEPRLLDWIRRQWENGCRLCSVGSASFLLAEAGLLAQQPATTHWYYFDRFAHIYPDILLKRNHLITKSGRLYCVGSVNSLADLVVQLIAEAFGQPIAEAVERQFSPEIRQPSQNRMFNPDSDSPHADDEIIDAQNWLRTHYGLAIAMPTLATQLGISVRSFNRRFKSACGLTPGDFLRQIRIDNAKSLLKDSNLTVTEVAAHVGYSNVSHFSQVFKRWAGATPRRYRTQVRGKLFTDPQRDG